MWRCHVCRFSANFVVYYCALTPSHQNPPPIGSRRSRWAVPDLCQCPITVEDRRQTHIQINTNTRAHTHKGKWREGKERKRRETVTYTARLKEQTSVADLPTIKKSLHPHLLLTIGPGQCVWCQHTLPIERKDKDLFKGIGSSLGNASGLHPPLASRSSLHLCSSWWRMLISIQIWINCKHAQLLKYYILI